MRFSEWIKIDKPFFAWVPAGLWGINILILSVVPYTLTPTLTVGYFDKICHFSAYGIFVFLLMWGIKRSRRSLTAKNIAFALIFAICYGIVIEIFQGFIPGREACMYDAFFNMIGVVTGTYLGRLILWRR